MSVRCWRCGQFARLQSRWVWFGLGAQIVWQHGWTYHVVNTAYAS